MSISVIDALVVTLGLDAKQWTKGREQADKDVEETRRHTKTAADDISKSLLEVGKTIGGLFLGFETATGFAKFLGNLNVGEAALGRTAANINMSAHELNKWGNAVQLAGGDAADAQVAFGQLTEDFQKMAATGEQSQLLQFFRARGVNIRDENGNLRDQGKLFEELADKTAQYGRQYQVTMFKQAGLAQGYINYLVQTKTAREELLRAAERNNGVDEESVRKAQELQQYWRDIGQQVSKVGQEILSSITPTLEAAVRYAKNLYVEISNSDQAKVGVQAITGEFKNLSQLVGTITGGWKALIGLLATSKPPAWIAFIERTASALVNFFPNLVFKNKFGWDTGEDREESPAASDTSAAPYVPPAGSKAARNNNPGNIQRNGVERRYATPEEGAAALESDLRAKMARGLKTVDAIIDAYEGGDNVHNDIPAYIADVKRRIGKNQVSESDIAQLARAISIHESGPSAGRSGGGSSNSTSIEVGKIEVHSASADPRAVAEQIPAAIKRKYAITQADTGQS